MKKFTKPIGIIGMSFIILYSSSCATITGGRVGDCQKHRPEKGQPKRQIKVGKLVWDIVLGGCCLGVGIPVFVGIDFATRAIYKPCGDSIEIDPKTGKERKKGFVN